MVAASNPQPAAGEQAQPMDAPSAALFPGPARKESMEGDLDATENAHDGAVIYKR